MTLFQETASARTLVPSERAFTAKLLAITAGLVVVLMAVAVTSYVAGRPADANIQGNADTAAMDGWESAAIAASRQHRIDAAQPLTDGWEAALVPQRTITATDGWEAALIRPHEAAADRDIQRFLLEADEAAADGYTLRFPMQPEESAVDGYNQRFARVD